MNRTLALVVTAIVSVVVGGASIWFVLRPGFPADNGLEASPPSEAQFSLTEVRRGLESSEVSPAQRIDLEQLAKKGVILNQVIEPIPREAFAGLGLLEKRRWLQVSRSTQKVSIASRAPEDTALHLGATISDGFVAAEVDDIQKFDMVVRNLEFLSRALGAEKILKRRFVLILSGAKARDWRRVRAELDSILLDIEEGTGEPVADLVRLGGWLRGTEALTAMISTDYSKDAAELLHQPSVLDHFIRRLDGRPGGARTELVGDVYKALTELRPLMGSSAPTPSAPDVKTINRITGALVERITLAPSTGQSISLR